MAIPVSTIGTVADQRRAEMIQLLALLMEQEVLDEEFNFIQSMESESAPTFVVDTINSFFLDTEKISKIFHELLAEKENTDFEKVEVYANQMVGCSSTIGASSIRDVCVILRIAAEEYNHVECLDALEMMDDEFAYFKIKMEEFIQIKHEFEVASGIFHPPQN